MGPTRHLCGIRTDRYMIGDATCLILAGNKSIWLVDLIRRPVAEFAVAFRDAADSDRALFTDQPWTLFLVA